MVEFSFCEIKLKGAYIITSPFMEDNRGSFVKDFERNIFGSNGIRFECSETFISKSVKNVIRGMHFQTHNPQAKLVNVISGKVYDVIVDLRRESPTFGKWEGVYLSYENRTSLYVPKGFAHGFVSLSDESLVSYKCDGQYDLPSDTGIRYNDKDIGIEWPISDISQAIVSEKDKALMSYQEFINNVGGFEYES